MNTSNYQLFWGDLHSHCSISYGHGSLDQALARANQQLDFCSVTGHAFWPDMPQDREQYAEIIDYHDEGFATCAKNWNELLEGHARWTKAGDFLAIPSYEWHSLKYGDHNMYAPISDLPLKDAVDLPAMREVIRESGGVAIPHHIGYKKGYRGINWDEYKEDVSPFVEMFSLHGCSLGTDAAYPMLHDMGPRDFGSTAEEGWLRGHKFGIVGGTDHHAAYPGSHGDGRMGVFAKDLTPEAIFEAFKARRVYAATGDKIDARFHINDAWIGDVIQCSGTRKVKLNVAGIDEIDQVRVIKNGKTIRRFSPNEKEGNSYRVRVTWGWGRKTELTDWNVKLSIGNSEITQIDTCFSGQAVVAPKTDNDEESLNAHREEGLLPHEIVASDAQSVEWTSVTSGNLTMRHATTQAISLAVNASPEAPVRLEANGQVFEFTIAELTGKARSNFMRGWLTEAIQIEAVPVSLCEVEAEFEDEATEETDIYRLEVNQKNGHWAWLTPIWVERE